MLNADLIGGCTRGGSGGVSFGSYAMHSMLDADLVGGWVPRKASALELLRTSTHPAGCP